MKGCVSKSSWRSRLVQAGALAGAALAAGPAAAATVVLPVSQALQAGGGVYGGQFDIAAFLTSGVTISGAKVIAKGGSAFTPMTTLGAYGPDIPQGQSQHLVTPPQPIYQTVCVLFTCQEQIVGYTPAVYATDTTYRRERTITQIDPYDVMVLDVGQGFDTGASATHSVSMGPFVFDFTQTTGSFAAGFNDFDHYTRQIVDGWFGPIEATAFLTAGDLAGLNANGFLDFTVAAAQGGFTLSHLELQFDLAEAAVPEPGAWGLMILGFAGAGTALRRAKRTGFREIRGHQT